MSTSSDDSSSSGKSTAMEVMQNLTIYGSRRHVSTGGTTGKTVQPTRKAAPGPLKKTAPSSRSNRQKAVATPPPASGPAGSPVDEEDMFDVLPPRRLPALNTALLVANMKFFRPRPPTSPSQMSRRCLKTFLPRRGRLLARAHPASSITLVLRQCSTMLLRRPHPLVVRAAPARWRPLASRLCLKTWLRH